MQHAIAHIKQVSAGQHSLYSTRKPEMKTMSASRHLTGLRHWQSASWAVAIGPPASAMTSRCGSGYNASAWSCCLRRQ